MDCLGFLIGGNDVHCFGGSDESFTETCKRWFTSAALAAVSITVGKIALPMIVQAVTGAVIPATIFTATCVATVIFSPCFLFFIPVAIYNLPWMVFAAGTALATGISVGSGILAIRVFTKQEKLF